MEPRGNEPWVSHSSFVIATQNESRGIGDTNGLTTHRRNVPSTSSLHFSNTGRDGSFSVAHVAHTRQTWKDSKATSITAFTASAAYPTRQ